MRLSAMPTHELIKACIPTRQERKRIAGALGYSDESVTYKWTEDPDGSGRPNPLDKLEVLLDHARVHHPHAAFAIEHRIADGNARAVSRHGVRMLPPELMAEVQPGVEKEASEALAAFTCAMRHLLLGQSCDLPALLLEVEQAERELKRARLMISAAIEAGDRPLDD